MPIRHGDDYAKENTSWLQMSVIGHLTNIPCHVTHSTQKDG